MAKNTQPVVKRAKALGVTPASLGYTGKSKIDTIRNPKAQVRRKQSEYGMQLNEKQKVKFIYGVLEKQFRLYYESTEKGKSMQKIKENIEDNAFRAAPKWIEYDKNNLTAKIIAVPAREDIDMPIEERLIVELYSK